MVPDPSALFAINRPEDFILRLPTTLLSPVASVGKVLVGQILPGAPGFLAQVVQDTFCTVGGVVACSAANCGSLLSLPGSALKLSHTMLTAAVGRTAPANEQTKLRNFNGVAVSDCQKRVIRRSKKHVVHQQKAMASLHPSSFELLVVDVSPPRRTFTPSSTSQVDTERWVATMGLQSSML